MENPLAEIRGELGHPCGVQTKFTVGLIRIDRITVLRIERRTRLSSRKRTCLMALVSDTRIFILLCTCDGAEHLDEQLASYEAQTHENWALWVSDDGSQDGTLEILRSWQERWQGRHEMRLFSGARQGAAANFMSLLTHPELPRCTVALSDQDDVWHPDKLARALDTLAALPSDQPGLYGAQSIYTDADLHPTGRSVPPLRGPSFANALTQNSVSGHSATLNPATLDLVRHAGVPTGIPFHDWWLYQLVTGAGGWVLVDTQAVLFYRQHENNVLGAHLGRNAFRQRLTMVADGSYGDWIAANLAALDQVSHLLLPNHAKLVHRILNKPRGPLRFWEMARAGLHRQRVSNTVLFYVAALLGRI